METYRLSSKITEQDREYLIKTTNDAGLGTVRTTVFIDGVPAESLDNPHPVNIDAKEVLSLVKTTHEEKKRELETVLRAYRQITPESDPQMLYNLGTAFFYKGFYNEARELLEAVTKLDPDNHQALDFLGRTELARGDFKAAVAVGRKAVEEKPNYPDFRNNYAEALLADNQTDAAIEELEQAIRLNMYYSDAYYNLGLAKLLRLVTQPEPSTFSADIQEAGDLFHRASLTYADLKGEAFSGAMEALKRHDLIQAMNMFQRVREEKKEQHRVEFASFYMRFVLHPELISEKAVADRIRFLESELKRNPTYADLLLELSHCYFEQAQLAWKNGLEKLRKTIELNPSLSRVSEDAEAAEEVHSRICDLVKRLEDRG
ncbi:MAG: tetratricopeptide repeat protein [Candidatus Zixiibacteriota bacterium]|nr:MAG: tetratricopeptide repeat protein [candidate division Zixibacteria bacterium]